MNSILHTITSIHQACLRHGIYQAIALCLAVIAALGFLIGVLLLQAGSSSFSKLSIPIYLTMSCAGYLLLYAFCLALYGWKPCPGP